jgi:hypothetical protein
MATRYFLGDFREGRVVHTGIFEAVFSYCDRVGATVPFAHDPSPRLQSEARIWSHAALGPKHLRQCLEPTAGRLPKPTVFKLLAPIGDPAKEKIAADPWGLAAVEPPPLGFQFDAWAGGEGMLPCGKLNFGSRGWGPRRLRPGRGTKIWSMDAYVLGDATVRM